MLSVEFRFSTLGRFSYIYMEFGLFNRGKVTVSRIIESKESDKTFVQNLLSVLNPQNESDMCELM